MPASRRDIRGQASPDEHCSQVLLSDENSSQCPAIAVFARGLNSDRAGVQRGLREGAGRERSLALGRTLGAAEFRFDDYRQVVDSRAPMWRRGKPRSVPALECAEVKVLRLPLTADALVMDMIVSVCLYPDSKGQPLANLSHRPLGY